MSKPRLSPATKPIAAEKPVFDFARGAGALPLDGTSKPRSLEELTRRLLRGYEARLLLPEDKSAITASGETYPHLNLLRIDVSNALVQQNYKPTQASTIKGDLEPALSVTEFQYLASPLRYADRMTNWQLRVRDAQFAILREKSGRAALVLTDAAEGSLDFSAKLSDLKPMMLKGADTHAKAGFRVRDAALSLSSDNTRSLSAQLRVQAVWMLIPTTFHISGHMSIDDTFQVRLSDLACQGEDLGGSLVASLIGPSIRKYNGRVIPLAKWPGDRIELRDVVIRVDDALRLTVWFGQRPATDFAQHRKPAAIAAPTS